MEKLTIEILKKNNLIAYEYVRGSNLYTLLMKENIIAKKKKWYAE